MEAFPGFGPNNPLIMSAAGMCKTFAIEQIAPLAAAADRVLVGSITLDPRAGNDGTCENFDNPLYSLNSWAMPNPGKEAAVETTVSGSAYEGKRQLAALLNSLRLILSLAEFSPSGYTKLFGWLWGWSGQVELNFGCPNVRDDGSQHKIVSFDPVTMAEILTGIKSIKGEGGKSILTGVKLSPYSDPGLLKEVAAVIIDSRTVDYVACTNTFPNGLGYTPKHKPAIKTKQTGVFGGIGGEALKPISLANAAAFVSEFDNRRAEIDVIRVGGISSGEDLWQSYDVGCRGVQVATAIARHGPSVLTKIRQEYADIVG